jgi:hypothetical protein
VAGEQQFRHALEAAERQERFDLRAVDELLARHPSVVLVRPK